MKTPVNRRRFLKSITLGTAALALPPAASAKPKAAGNKPNIILCMTDDQGWGDTGYNGHPILKTPALDAMAANGIRFDRFYAGAPVCSPTRGSALTGRHPFRYGIFFANTGHIKEEEITLAEALKTQGYATGHFGKWHLGTLTKATVEANRGGPRGVAHYAPPWDNGFDQCFSTESKVPTYDPMITPVGKITGNSKPENAGKPYGTHYWTGPEQKADENLEGDDSRVIMDRAVPFIQDAVENKTPFFAVVWFHTPHAPVVAGPRHRKIYAGQSEDRQHYYGCVTAMDEQVGRLRKLLRDLGVADDTLLFFCSDNGPEGKTMSGRNQGTAKPFRGRKRSLYEGGIRVPGLLEWPARVKAPRASAIPCSTLDYFPTVMDVLGFKMKGQPQPVDGVSLLPLIDGKMQTRPVPIGFQSAGQIALSDNRYKIYSGNKGKTYELYDLVEDPSETTDLAGQKPEILNRMREQLEKWRASCADSNKGNDYE